MMYLWALALAWEDKMVFAPQDFGEVELNLPPGTSGRLVLEITAIADGASRHRSLFIYIHSNDTTTDETTTDETTSDEGTTPTTVPTRQTPSTEDPQTVTMGETPSMGTSTVSVETPDETPAFLIVHHRLLVWKCCYSMAGNFLLQGNLLKVPLKRHC